MSLEKVKVVCLPISITGFQNCYIYSPEIQKKLKENREDSKTCEIYLSINLNHVVGAGILSRLCDTRVADAAEIIRCDMRVWKIFEKKPGSEEEVVVNVDDKGHKREIDLAHHIMRLEGKELWNRSTLAVKFNDTLRCTSNDIQMLRLGTIKMMRLTVIFSSSTIPEQNGPQEKCLAFNSKLDCLLQDKIRDIFLANELRVNCSTLIDLRQCPLSSSSVSLPAIAYLYVENCDIYYKNSSTSQDKGIGRVNSQTEIFISTTNHVDFYTRLYQSSVPSEVSLAGLEVPMKLLEETIGMQEHGQGCPKKPVQTDGGHFSHGLLIGGSSGCGKTSVVREVAKKLRANLLVFSAATKPIHDVVGFSDSCTTIFSRAVISARLQPTVLHLKDLERLSSHEGKSLPDSPSALIKAKLLNHLCELFDAIPSNVSLTVVVTSNKPHLLSPKLRRAGRLQQELYIKMPNELERLKILEAIVATISSFSCYDLSLVARQTPGYAGADLERLTHLAALKANEESCSQVSDSHIKYALSQVLPTLLQGSIGRVDIQRAISLDHISGLGSVKLDLIKAIVWPLKYPNAFHTMGIQPPKGILLYGPPGCAKTTLVRAVAASHQTNFLAVSAAELFSSGVGDSEKIIADLFHRARMASPCLLFIDELEAVVGSRQSSGKNKTVNETILSTFLTEMDGVGVHTPILSTSSSSTKDNVILSGPRVIVVAATNRPDLIDSALLRPGRLDRLIPVPPPNESERLELLQKSTKNIPLQPDVDLGHIARETDCYSGADLVNLCNEAALFALEEDMDIQSVSMKHFIKAKTQSTPSLSLESLKLFKGYAGPSIS